MNDQLSFKAEHNEKYQFFEVIQIKAQTDRNYRTGKRKSEVTIWIEINGQVYLEAFDGRGNINAFDKALRKILAKVYPKIEKITLAGYKNKTLKFDKLGTGAIIETIIPFKFNELEVETTGKDEDYFYSGCNALMKGYDTCLKKFNAKRLNETQEKAA